MTTVTVAGASGYAGGELLRYLAQHPTFDLIAACAAGRAGEALGAVHPQFSATPWAGLILDETTPSVLGQADLVFAALPHGESAALVEQPLRARRVRAGPPNLFEGRGGRREQR